MKQLVYNAISCRGVTLVSRSRHDYQEHYFPDGSNFMVDGGLSYQRYRWSPELEQEIEPIAIYTDDPHEVIREYIEWGTYGINGDQPLSYLKLKDMDTDHIEAILETQTQIPEWRRKIFQDELEWRKK